MELKGLTEEKQRDANWNRAGLNDSRAPVLLGPRVAHPPARSHTRSLLFLALARLCSRPQCCVCACALTQVALQLGPKGKIPADDMTVVVRDAVCTALETVMSLGTVFDTAGVVTQSDIDMLARLVSVLARSGPPGAGGPSTQLCERIGEWAATVGTTRAHGHVSAAGLQLCGRLRSVPGRLVLVRSRLENPVLLDRSLTSGP